MGHRNIYEARSSFAIRETLCIRIGVQEAFSQIFLCFNVAPSSDGAESNLLEVKREEDWKEIDREKASGRKSSQGDGLLLEID